MARRTERETANGNAVGGAGAPSVDAAAEALDWADEAPPPDSVLSERAGDEAESREAAGALGRYQLLFELARGGMGVVYAARSRGPGGFSKLVALKRLHLQGGFTEELASVFDEARVTAAISHPNVVETLDVGEEDGEPFIAMELVEGVSLARLCRRVRQRGQQLDPYLVAWIGAAVAAGLHAAHELAGEDGEPYALVHRDVSPDNVLLSYEGTVKVADFGVAKFAGAAQRTESGVLKGKFAYMSPEQTEAHALDRRSDVFALGAVLHECLMGQRLFAGRSAAEMIRRVLEYQPRAPHELRPEIPEALSAVVLRCLEKQPRARYQTAGEVAAALRQVPRQHGRVVDASDLAELLAAHFHDERSTLRRRLAATRRIEAPAAPTPVKRSAAAARGETAHGSFTGSLPLHPRRGALWLGAGLAGALVAWGLWLARPQQQAPGSPLDGGAAVAAPSASAGGLQATDGPPAPPPHRSAAPSEPSARPSGAARTKGSVAPAGSTAPHRWLPPRHTTSTTTTAPSASSAPPTASSKKGVPFQTLDP